ncbi:DUF2065 domain-containing protein [Martelella lutilitoris]|uniref:DUF2065 domain-containing protein n=1 Tax=Martelella lutilitoris TaxID=2583532 RepID=A0A7T7HGV8_9HYPH|nr:DUF2065 domain-containing protein [Martelella lutilitoris]QQM28917.1 DUF2065 domain-containing protein [Martelella lutilitoris]|tara:strand:+ start:1321 stop:1512 length:192 start_codon:yes stop_codon:yes gene_type:complete
MLLQDVLIGFAFYLIIEGLVYALAPSLLVAMARLLPTVPEGALRVTGLIAVALGVGLVWLIRG